MRAVNVTLPAPIAADLLVRLRVLAGNPREGWPEWLGDATAAIPVLEDVLCVDEARDAEQRFAECHARASQIWGE